MAKDKIYAVVGLGIFGMKVCEVLAAKDAKVLAIDNHAENVEKAKEFAAQAILLDMTNPELLRTAPLQDVDVAIIAIGDNMEASILSTA
ncbi:MAG: TrkA family potassium uptake protein, partial [Spirochaetales bacterium]|nr:TrkA family potassium uptake protein [Spirochaetales bacterium]